MKGERCMRAAVYVSLAVLLGVAFTVPISAQNRACVPQFVSGFDGQSSWETGLTITRRSFFPFDVSVSFFDGSGRLFQNVVFADRRTTFERRPLDPLSRNPFTVRTGVDMLGADRFSPLRFGFVVIEATGTFNVTARFRQADITGRFIRETILRPIEPFRVAEIFAEEIERQNVGLVVTNMDPLLTAFGTLEFLPTGSQNPLFRFPVQLGPRIQLSRFLTEFFPLLPPGSTGSVRMTFDHPVCALAMDVRESGMSQLPITVVE